MKQLGIWILTAILFAALGGTSVWLYVGHEKGEEEAHETAEKSTTMPASASAPISRNEAGNTVVHQDRETQDRAGLVVTSLTAARQRPETIAYGTLQEDPARSFTLRAPWAGKIVSPTDGSWPALGSVLSPDTVIGSIEPRLTPTERMDLATRLADAEGRVSEAHAEQTAARISLEGKQRSNLNQKILSDQVIAEAQAAVAIAEAKLDAAMATVRILQAVSVATTQPAETLALRSPIEGRVVELLVHPGEAVENGQSLLRITRYDQLLAQIVLPAGTTLDENVRTARLAVAGSEDHPLAAERIAPAATSDATTGGPAYLFSLAADGLSLQPGLAVTAYLPVPGEARDGVIVPRSALLRYAGKVWAYVRIEPEQFERREIKDPLPGEAGWFVAGGFKPGDEIVTVGAQGLLAVELVPAAGEQGEEE